MSEFTETIVRQLQFAQWAATRNLEEMTHEDSIVRPSGGGNDFNWVLGHIVAVRNALLGAFGEQPVWEPETSRAYGTASTEETSSRLPLDDLRAAFETTHARLAAGIARADEATLDGKAPFSPGKPDPDETIRTLLGKVVVHESYHIGQLGVLRRAAGKSGAIRRG